MPRRPVLTIHRSVVEIEWNVEKSLAPLPKIVCRGIATRRGVATATFPTLATRCGVVAATSPGVEAPRKVATKTSPAGRNAVFRTGDAVT
jgi:hypothetical protein